MNYIEFYPGDYMRDTADLSLIEHGAYLLLLSHYYATETPLPSENPPVFRIARAMGEDEKLAVLKVCERFFPICQHDGLRHNSRADAEITKALERIEKNKANGRKGGRPPKPKANPTHNPNETQPITQTGTQTGTQTKAHHTPHAIEKQDQKRPAAPASDDPSALMIEAAVEYITGTGVGQKQARSLVGMLRKALGDDGQAAAVLAEMERDRIAEPAAWLAKVTKQRGAGKAAASSQFEGLL